MNLFKRTPKVKYSVDSDEFTTLSQLKDIPINVTIRRIKSKQSGNNWSAEYLKETVYYGKTLTEALGNLIKHSKKVQALIEKNKKVASVDFLGEKEKDDKVTQ